MKKFLKTFFLLLIPASVFGQLNPVSDQYILNPLTINPAFAGSRGSLNVAAFFRKQWVGIKGAPETLTLSGDSPLPIFDEKIGVGLTIISDKIGVTKETQFLTSYSYKVDLKKGTLTFGLGAGVIATNTAWSDLVALDPGDEFYLIDSRLFLVPNFSFGTYYTYEKHSVGFSVPKFLTYKFNFDKNKYSLNISPGKNSYLLNYGYLFTLSPKVKFFPSTLLTFTHGEKMLVDLNAYFNYIDRFWAGVSFRSGRAIAGLIQFQINNQLRAAYSYDVDINKLGRYSSGSHEIMIRYEFRYKVDVSNPLIF
jgi:type IX secretion system PorP/SprF family membrane protein